MNGLTDYNVEKSANVFQVLIDYILYTLFLAAPLIFFPGIQNFSNLPKGTFIQFAVCIPWLGLVLKSYPYAKLRLIRHPLLLVIALWLLWSGISITWAVDKFSAIMLWLHWFLCGLCFFVVVHTIKTLIQLDKLILFIVIGANIISVIGFLQYIFGMDLIPQAAIPGATFAHRNVAAQFVAFAWPFSLLLFISCTHKRLSWLFAFFAAVPFIFLYYTKTRAAWMAVLLSVFILVVLIFLANPNNPDAYVNLGLLYSSKKKWNQAVSLFKQAIKINPNSGAAHINIAVAYYMLGDYPSARTHSKKAKELGVPQADKVLEQLQ